MFMLTTWWYPSFCTGAQEVRCSPREQTLIWKRRHKATDINSVRDNFMYSQSSFIFLFLDSQESYISHPSLQLGGGPCDFTLANGMWKKWWILLCSRAFKIFLALLYPAAENLELMLKWCHHTMERAWISKLSKLEENPWWLSSDFICHWDIRRAYLLLL